MREIKLRNHIYEKKNTYLPLQVYCFMNKFIIILSIICDLQGASTHYSIC